MQRDIGPTTEGKSALIRSYDSAGSVFRQRVFAAAKLEGPTLQHRANVSLIASGQHNTPTIPIREDANYVRVSIARKRTGATVTWEDTSAASLRFDLTFSMTGAADQYFGGCNMPGGVMNDQTGNERSVSTLGSELPRVCSICSREFVPIRPGENAEHLFWFGHLPVAITPANRSLTVSATAGNAATIASMITVEAF